MGKYHQSGKPQQKPMQVPSNTQVLRDSVQNWISQAEEAKNSGRYEESLRFYTRIVFTLCENKPILDQKLDDAITIDSCFACADLHEKLGNIKHAQEYLRQGHFIQIQYCDAVNDRPRLIESCTNALSLGDLITPQERKEILTVRAKGYFDCGNPDYKAIIVDLNEALTYEDADNHKGASNFEKIYNGLGLAHAGLKQYSKAVEYYSKAIKHGGARSYIYMNRGDVYVELKAWKKAIQDFQEVLKLDHTSFVAYRRLGQISQKQGKPQAALKEYDASLKIKKDAMIYYYIGSAYDDLNAMDEAINSYKESLALANNYVDVLYAVGVAFLKRNNHDKEDPESAICYLKQAIELDPDIPGYSLGDAYFKQGDYTNALKIFTEASSLDPKNSDVLVKRGQIFHIQGNRECAAQDYVEALELNPMHADAHYCSGYLALDEGDSVTAKERFQSFIECFDKKHADVSLPKPTSDKLDALFFRGTAYYYLGRYEEARSDLAYCVAHDVNHTPRNYNNLGLVYRLLGQYADGIHAFTKALLHSKGTLTQAYRNRGLCYYQNGQYQEALDDYSAYLEHHPEDIVALNNRGSCYLQLHDYHAAHRAYSNVLTLSPDDPDAKYSLSLKVSGVSIFQPNQNSSSLDAKQCHHGFSGSK
ncbi:MAG: hypothetical protein CK424_06060 [Legionella sp.]|nr:MAG: hypothetical protein CK424_06060 [Legionella sp.]